MCGGAISRHWLSGVTQGEKVKEQNQENKWQEDTPFPLEWSRDKYSVGRVQDTAGRPIPGFVGDGALLGTGGQCRREGEEQTPQAPGYTQNTHLTTTQGSRGRGPLCHPQQTRRAPRSTASLCP